MKKSRLLPVIVAIIAAAIILPVAWVLASPLWINQRVDESAPVAASSNAAAKPMADTANSKAMTDTAMSTAMTATVMGPQLLVSGAFYDVAHEGQGKASIQQLEDGTRVLRFEDFNVLNGPDLYVYLVPVAPVPNTIAAEIPGSVSLGRLKGNIGNQNYVVPPSINLANFKSVVIWCQAFRVPFSAATLQ